MRADVCLRAGLFQQVRDHFLQGLQIARCEQRGGEFMHLVLQTVVLLGEFDQIMQLLFQYLVLGAQVEQLAFAQRDRATAVWMGQRNLEKYFGVFLKEFRGVNPDKAADGYPDLRSNVPSGLQE